MQLQPASQRHCLRYEWFTDADSLLAAELADNVYTVTTQG